MHLQGRIADLNTELKAFAVTSERDLGNFTTFEPVAYQGAFDKFDAFSHPSSFVSSGQMSSSFQSQPLGQSQQDGMGLPELESLPGFEDLLNLS
jgi:hypothetical protein